MESEEWESEIEGVKELCEISKDERYAESELKKEEGPLGVEPGTTSCRDYGSNAISSSQESAPCEF